MFYRSGKIAATKTDDETLAADKVSFDVNRVDKIDNSIEYLHKAKGQQDVYITLFKSKSADAGRTISFKIFATPDFYNTSIRFVTSNVGNINPACGDAMVVKLCERKALDAYRSFISDKNPDIVNLQEVVTYKNCADSFPEQAKMTVQECIKKYPPMSYEERLEKHVTEEYCPSSMVDIEARSVCGDIFEYRDKHYPNWSTAGVYFSGSELIFDPDVIGEGNQYDFVCDRIKQYDCIAFKKNKFQRVDEIISGYPPLPCDQNGVSVSALKLREVQSGRVFVVGNAHPEAFKSDCRAEAMRYLFDDYIKDAINGVPSNAIVSGDFNMDVTTQESDNTKDGPSVLTKRVRFGGYNQIGDATYKITSGGYLDHVFTNIQLSSYHCDEVPRFPDLDHRSIFCDLKYK